MVSSGKRFAAILMFIFAGAVNAYCQTSPVALEKFQTAPERALLQSCVLLAGPSAVRFEVIGASEQGLIALEIGTAERIISHKECHGAPLCRMAGAIATAQLKSDIVSVQVVAKNNRSQTEKIRLNLRDNVDKIYLVAAVPGGAVSSPEEFATPTAPIASTATGTTDTGQTLTFPPPVGPELTVNIESGNNEYTVSLKAADPTGVDFIEILENGSFLDVQVCDNARECTFTTTLSKRKPGANRYLFKTMNMRGALSYKEQTLEFK